MAQLNNLIVSGNARVLGNEYVNGNITDTGTLTVNGAATMNSTVDMPGEITTGNLRPKSIVAYNSRLASADFDHAYPQSRASERLDIASSTMTTHKPPSGDGFIKTYMWDNSGAYDFQIAFPDVTPKLNLIALRARGNSSWGDWSTLLNMIYPIGAIYLSINSTDPGTLFGGTWERLSSRYLYAGTDTELGNQSTQTGSSSSSVTLTAAQSGVPAHSHGASYSGANFYVRHGSTSGTATAASGTNTSLDTGVGDTWSNGFSTASYSHKIDRINIGGTVSVNNNTAANASAGHSHTNSYICVAVWKRTA